MIEDRRIITFTCNDCGATISIESATKKEAYKALRRSAWGMNSNCDTFYCANCAPLHRHVGCKGARQAYQTRLPLD